MVMEKMCWFFLYLLILLTLTCGSCAENEGFIISCSENQKAFRGSCFEFVGLRHSFFRAQARCEEGGGHLAFINDEDTQSFLQGHLDPNKDAWFGVAQSKELSLTGEGPLTWLDGSPVSYSKWVSGPQPGAACGHILRNSGFQWEATKDCSEKRPFICEIETGRSIVCADYDTILQCGSGRLITIDQSLYGRLNPHYCRSIFTAATYTPHKCGWVDVVESVAAHCNGRQLCRTAELMSSFGEQCPDLGSYLSVDYHCEDSLMLSVNTVAAVFHDVHIRVKLLTRGSEGNLRCELSTGDGHVVYLTSPQGFEHSVVHKYTHPSTFTVTVECISGITHSTAWKIITIQEPITEIGVIKCFAGNLSFPETSCKALHGAALHIQMEVKADTNVTYRVQRKEKLLSGLSVVKGNVPQNITMSGEVVNQIGPGCHHLTIYASNLVTFPEVSTDLQVCVMEKLAGLEASMLTETDACSVPAHFTVGVSLERGMPALLLFYLVGDNSSFSATREMTTSKAIFYLRHPSQGALQVTLRAWNDFSYVEEHVEILGSCGKNSVIQSMKHIRAVRSSEQITATPSSSVTDNNKSITLSISGSMEDDSKYRYEWECLNPCPCQGASTGLTKTITGSCLPDPFHFSKYYFNEIKISNNKKKEIDSICITVTPKIYSPDVVSLTCVSGCNPTQSGKEAKIKMICILQCPTVIWNIEDPADDKDWPHETKSCYKGAERRPLIERKDGGDEYTVKSSFLELAKKKKQNIRVVISTRGIPLYTTYIIKTSSPDATPASPQATTIATTPTTAITTPVTKATTPATGVTTPVTKATTPATGVTTPVTKATTTATGLTTPVTKATTPATGVTTPVTKATTPATGVTTPVTKATTPATGVTTPVTKATTPATGVTTPVSKATTPSTTITTPVTKATTPATGVTTPVTKATTPSTGVTTPVTKATTPATGVTTPVTKATTPSTTVTTPVTKATTPATGVTTPATKATTSASKATAATTVNKATTENKATTATKISSFVTTSPTSATTARGKTSETTFTKFGSLSCTTSPSTRTVLENFNITCQTTVPCPTCQYCFKADVNHLRCSTTNVVNTIFLPVGDEPNYILTITATASDGNVVASTAFTATVHYPTVLMSHVVNLNATIMNTVAQLRNQGILSGETLGQLFFAVATQINYHVFDPVPPRQKLREEMVALMIDVVEQATPTTPQEVQAIARGLSAVVFDGTELSLTSQIAASTFFQYLSSTFVVMDISDSEETKNEIYLACSAIMEGVSYIFGYSSNKMISDALLDTLNNMLSGLLLNKETNGPPTVIQREHISVLAERVLPEKLNSKPLNFSNCVCAGFFIPTPPPSVSSSKEPVDLRMMSFYNNPFSWHDGGNINGLIGALSITDIDGAVIPVENLSEEIEIFLPNPAGGQLHPAFLDLGNFSTTIINVSSANTTLVLKMIPSEEPLPLKVYLGYLEYPTVTNYVAMAEMPQQGPTTVERYTWLVDPVAFKGNTGAYYLVVRPIVGPGIKSINASVTITPIMASCQFWNNALQTWSNNGCRVGANSTDSVTQCLCNHLTFFGSSFFVTPNLVDPSRTTELFSSFGENPVVVCFVGALFVTFLLVVVWARRKDIKDIAKVKVSVLEDNDPMDQYQYLLSIGTGHRIGASTSSQVALTLLGTEGNSEPHHLSDPKKRVFERGAVDLFLLCTPFALGDLRGIRLWHNNSGDHPAWYVSTVMVQDVQTKQKWHFLCNSWLSVDMDDCTLDRVFPTATDDDLKRFSNLFFMRTTKDFNDGHLWFSVVNRPPGSNFTCVQRVSCCFSLLLCTMLTSIMFYGIPTDPAEQTLDLGHFEFTWQQFMVGVQSSLIMFPVNILIVSVFRNTRPRETSCCQCIKQKNILEEDINSQAAPTNANANITLDVIIKDITRIANSLSKTAKSNIPSTKSEFGPGQQNDINAVLSAVEDVIKQNKKTPKQSKARPWVSVKGVEKKSNKTQYLYKQLCHMKKQLSQLGPSSFPSAQNHSEALQQVQRMKGLLEDQLFRSNCINIDESSKKSNLADGSDDNESKTKKRYHHGGLLPWWFIFVGWLLVIATSVISGYFTMLYGLKFGKERSISWLVSMVVSFFQSLLFIQPIKVLCLAVFFALVIKNVDEEDLQNVAVARNDGNSGDGKDLQPRRRVGGLYDPPPPSDIEKMRRNRILEQKAFALLREILTYMGFMWMLLLVAYGQRDPNAFFLNQHISKSFSQNISDSMSLGDVFAWTRTSLLSNLFGVYPGFITDGNSKLVGNARLRQLRVQRSSCQIAGVMQELVPDCHAPYSWDKEDTGSYEPGWSGSLMDNISTSIPDPWTYQTQAQLRSYPIWGHLDLYRGGGFVAELGPDSETASSTLDYLSEKSWLDMYTRAIVVEFTVYNANVNLFCIVTLLLETAAVGAFQFHTELRTVRLYQSTGGLHIFVMAAEIIYLLFILYYMFLQGKLMKQQRCAYFKNKWNLLELTIILLSWSAVAVFIKRSLLGNRDIKYYHDHKDQFASFYETATADAELQYLIAFLVMFSTVKMWHLLRLHPKMNMISATLQRAWSDITGFLLVITIMLLAYSFTSYMIYGWRLSSYRTLANAILTIFSLQIGKFDYEEVLSNASLMGGLLFGSCIVFMTFVVVNLLISVILVAFNEEQIHHKPSEEEEVVDMMLRKIFSVFGIRYKGAADSPELDANGHNGRNVLNSSPEDANVFHLKPDKKIDP